MASKPQMDQALALAILKAGHNVLLTGSAGTGKTYVLNQFIAYLKQAGIKHAVTASTGLAATHLGGQTIHSWAKIGIRDYLSPRFTQKISQKDKERIKTTEVLIIDEISMLHDFRLDMVDQVLRRLRRSQRPFGGLQVVLCGDFFQLPPVNSSREQDEDSPPRRGGGFAVHAEVWPAAAFEVCYLTASYRHSDPFFCEILDAIRAGDVRRRHAEALLGRLNASVPETAVTELHVTNIDSDRINQRELRLLDTPSYSYEAELSGNKKDTEKLASSCLAERELVLKVGAKVMFIRNNPTEGYVNGTLGMVIDFTPTGNLPLVRTTEGRVITVERETWELTDEEDQKPRARLTQLPLKLAWAITVHKSQGMTLDAATIDLSRAFVEGMGYVALSRVKQLDRLYLKGINKMAIRVAPEALTIDERLRAQSADTADRSDELLNPSSSKRAQKQAKLI